MVRKVGDFLTESKIPGSDGKLAKKLSVKLWAKGVVEKNAAFEGSEHTQYYVRHAGQFMYGKLDFLNCAFGIVPDKLDGYESTLDAPAFNIHGIDPIFLLNKVMQPNFYKKNGEIANGSRKAKRIHPDTFLEMELVCPSVEEQKRIAEFITVIDARIEAQRKLVDALKSYKRGVSNAIFAHSVGFHHEGETETFTWCVMPFGEVFDFLNSNTLSRADLNYFGGEVKNIHYGDILTKYGAITDPSSSTVPYINIDAPLSYLKLDYLKTGDIVIADTAEDLTAGKVTEIACSNEAKCVSGLHTVACRPRQRFASGYLGHYLNSAYYHRQLLPLIQGTKVSSIARSALAGTQIAFPCLSDQIKVSKCLSLIDTRVESEERKLERLVECKKSLLQKLFV